MNTNGAILNTLQANFLKINNSVNVSSVRGMPPLGTIIGFNLTPTASIVNGWAKCDGSVVPAGNALAGITLPNLTSSVFLAGSTTTAVWGNVSNSITINNTHIPTHNHSGNTVTISSTSSNHTHSITNPTVLAATHSHYVPLSSNNKAEVGASSGNPAGLSTYYNYSISTISFTGYGVLATGQVRSGFSHNTYVAGTTGTYGNGKSIYMDDSGWHSHSGSGTTVNAGTGTTFNIDISPLCLTTIFLMRVN
jgi:hypothetical protein